MKKREEQKLHTWIEAQNREEKDRAKAALFQRENERLQTLEEKGANVTFTAPNPRPRFLGVSVWKGVAAALCVCILAVAGFYGLQSIGMKNMSQGGDHVAGDTLQSDNQDEPGDNSVPEGATGDSGETPGAPVDSSETPGGPNEDERRYQYIFTDQKLKDYDLGFLYLDWYDQHTCYGAYIEDLLIGEIVFYQENYQVFFDEERWEMVYLSVATPAYAEAHWEMDEGYTQISIRGVDIDVKYGYQTSSAYFQYQGYCYQVVFVQHNEDLYDKILLILDELLP